MDQLEYQQLANVQVEEDEQSVEMDVDDDDILVDEKGENYDDKLLQAKDSMNADYKKQTKLPTLLESDGDDDDELFKGFMQQDMSDDTDNEEEDEEDDGWDQGMKEINQLRRLD